MSTVQEPDRQQQQRAAVKTAVVLALVAIGVYAWAILSRL